MVITSSWYRKVLILLGMIAIISFIAGPAAASLTVVGSKYMGEIAPGTTVTHSITLKSQPGDDPTDLSISVMGFGETPGQVYTSLSPSEDTSPYSARKFITLDSSTVHLNPGESKTVTATIAVPKDAGDGGRYAIIQLKTGPSGSGSTGYITAVSIPVMITLAKTAVSQKGTITEVNVGDIVAGQPYHIVTSLQNTGNIHYYSTQDAVKITDANKNIIASANTPPLTSAVIPGYTINFDLPFNTPLSPGTYTITSQVSLFDGTILDTKTIPFEVKTTYIAPPSQETITVTPQSPAILASADGRIRADFPAGAVISDATVTLKPQILTELPTLPQGVVAGGTCFKIDGLSGLLSKDATLTVKYSDADLRAAGGDTSKLVLARYDAPDNKWTMMDTSVNKDAASLSVSTNRFSIWAVVVSSGGGSTTQTSQTPGGFLPPSIVTVLGALGVAIAIIGLRLKRD